MSRLLAAAIFVALLGSVLLLTSAAAQCNIPPVGNACPQVSPNGDCAATLAWFQKNEVDCKGKPHGAILLNNGNQLKVTGAVPFKVLLGKFKEYKMPGGKCDDNQKIPHPILPLGLKDPNAATPNNVHTLTASARHHQDACYGVFFVLNGGAQVDPHIIVTGN